MKKRRIALFLLAVVALFTVFSCISFADDEHISFELTSEAVAPSKGLVTFNTNHDIRVNFAGSDDFAHPGDVFELKFNTSYYYQPWYISDTGGTRAYGLLFNGLSLSTSSSSPTILTSYNVSVTSTIVNTTNQHFFKLSLPDPDLSVSFNGSLLDSQFYSGNTISGTLTADEGFVLPSELSVKMGDAYTTLFDYDPETGELSIENVTGNIEITASAGKDLPAFFKFFYNLGSSLFGTSGLVPQAFTWVTSSAVLPWFCVGVVISLITFSLFITKSLFWGR